MPIGLRVAVDEAVLAGVDGAVVVLGRERDPGGGVAFQQRHVDEVGRLGHARRDVGAAAVGDGVGEGVGLPLDQGVRRRCPCSPRRATFGNSARHLLKIRSGMTRLGRGVGRLVDGDHRLRDAGLVDQLAQQGQDASAAKRQPGCRCRRSWRCCCS